MARAAAKRIRTQPTQFGRFRHCFVTWAQDVSLEVRPKAGGVPLATVAGIVGHKSARTTKLFYTGYRVPVLIRLALRLENPDDPVALLPSAKAHLKSSRPSPSNSPGLRGGQPGARSRTHQGPARVAR